MDCRERGDRSTGTIAAPTAEVKPALSRQVPSLTSFVKMGKIWGRNASCRAAPVL